MRLRNWVFLKMCKTFFWGVGEGSGQRSIVGGGGMTLGKGERYARKPKSF